MTNQCFSSPGTGAPARHIFNNTYLPIEVKGDRAPAVEVEVVDDAREPRALALVRALALAEARVRAGADDGELARLALRHRRGRVCGRGRGGGQEQGAQLGMPAVDKFKSMKQY